jgi:DNA-binding NarL/FixJ family response regulator
MTTLRLLLADDHEIVRRGLRELLQERPGWTVCAEAATGREAVVLAETYKPHVAIIDLSMPELNGLEATRRIRQALPETEVLIFTMHDSEHLMREVLGAGARGYLLKSDAARYIGTAVEALAQHKPFFIGRISEMMLNGYLRGSGEPTRPQLTSREREIMQLLAEGNSNKKIATALELSVKTVEAHRAAIMRKLGLRSLPELVRFAVRSRMIEP